MRIALDYTSGVYQRAGIGRYTRGLVAALAGVGGEHRYTLVVAGGDGEGDVASGLEDNFLVRRLPLSQRFWTILWHRLRVPLPIDLYTGLVDVFHSPDYVLPPLRRGKKVVTVHDLSFLRYPEGAESSLRRYLSSAVPRSVDKADLVLADSDSTRCDVVELLGVPPSKVEVLYPGVDEAFRPVEDSRALADVREAYRLRRPFLLTVGTLEPRKNIVTLLEAFAELRRGRDFEHQLVIAGALGWRYEGIFSRVAELSLEDSVSFLDYVPEEHLPALYSLADLLVFPSLYEGFGLPPLEAMACGTPVVTSNASSLPEVIGDAGLMVAAEDSGALAEAITTVLEDSDLRRELVGRGLSRAALFGWRNSAERLMGIYRRVHES